MQQIKEIKKRINELKEERDSRHLSFSTRGKYNGRIRELEWVLNN